MIYQDEAVAQNKKCPDRLEEPIEAKCTNSEQADDSHIIPAVPTRSTEVSLDAIVIDDRYQSRTALNPEVVDEYEAALLQSIQDGQSWPFPPLTCVYDLLCDGFHRYEAARRVGIKKVPVVIHRGDHDDAMRIAVSANANHGLRRSGDDRRRAILMALETWPELSNREIAKLCHVSHTWVNKTRSSKVETVSTQGKTDEQPSSQPAFDDDPFGITSTAPVDSVDDDPFLDSSDETADRATQEQKVAKRLKATIEAAMRDADEFNRHDRQPDYMTFDTGIGELWEIAKQWAAAS